VELLTITAKIFFCVVNIGGIIDHHCLNFLLFINKTKENLSNDSQQFFQNQQNKRKFKQ
jgi:hypothetical protein